MRESELFEKVRAYAQAHKNYPLTEKAAFIVHGARVFDDAPVSNPSFHTPRLGVVKGRYVDVIAWAVQQEGFYGQRQGEGDLETGTITKEERKVFRAPTNHKLDKVLD